MEKTAAKRKVESPSEENAVPKKLLERRNHAAERDAQIKLSVEECA